MTAFRYDAVTNTSTSINMTNQYTSGDLLFHKRALRDPKTWFWMDGALLDEPENNLEYIWQFKDAGTVTGTFTGMSTVSSGQYLTLGTTSSSTYTI